jgi:hypothetical protein
VYTFSIGISQGALTCGFFLGEDTIPSSILSNVIGCPVHTLG